MKKLFPIFIVPILFYGCTLNNVTVDDSLQKYFSQNQIKGAFALLDDSRQTFTICNLARYKDSSFAPCGSFDILSSLIAIEIGRLKDENSIINLKSDSSKTIALKDAFKTNDSAAFKSVASSVGKDTMQFWLDSLHYGKTKIKSNNESFWTNDSLKLTPDEQLGFIKKLYLGTLPFQKRVQDIVRNMMFQQSTSAYNISYHASWNTNSQGKNIGWVLGWIEENRHDYFFVINAESLTPSPSTPLLENTLKEILQQEGFFQGKK